MEFNILSEILQPLRKTQTNKNNMNYFEVMTELDHSELL